MPIDPQAKTTIVAYLNTLYIVVNPTQDSKLL